MTYLFCIALGTGLVLQLWVIYLYKEISKERKEHDQTFKDFQRANVEKTRFFTMWQDAQKELNRKGEDICEALGRHRGHSDLVDAVKQLRVRCEFLEEEKRLAEESRKVWENPHD